MNKKYVCPKCESQLKVWQERIYYRESKVNPYTGKFNKTINNTKGRNKMKILIDIDSTIYSTGKTIINLWNKYNPNRRLEYKEPLDWKFENILKSTDVKLKELFEMFDKKEFYDYVELFDNVEEVINNLSKDNEVIFCSKHCESRKPITAKFIKDKFPKCKLIFVDSFEEKKNIEGDIIIDDKLESLGGVQYCQLLYGDYLWNKGEYYNRVSNWKNIEHFVKYIS